MSDHKYEARLRALNEWAALIETRGYATPSPGDLARIAETKDPAAPGLDPLLLPWQGALKELLKLVMFNISDPHLQLEAEFEHPAGAQRRVPAADAAPAPETRERTSLGGGGTELVFRTLKAWKDKAEAEGQGPIKRLKDTHLRQVTNSRFTTAEEIRSVLPGSAAELAEEIQGVLASLPGGSNQPTPVEDPALSGQGNPATMTLADEKQAGSEHHVKESMSWMNAAPTVTEPEAAPTPPPAPAPVAAPAHSPTAAPTAAPVAAPVSAPLRATGPTELPGDLTRDSFATLDYSRQQSAPGPMQVTSDPNGATRLSWKHEDVGMPVRIYRVVSDDEHIPYSPDQSALVAISAEPRAVDDRPFTSAVRYLQVWVNEGATVAEALAGQPLLIAEQSLVAPVANLDIREDEGRVIGQWTTFPGTNRVQVFRIPIEKAAYAAGDAKYRIALETSNLNGFVDSNPVRGAGYLYQVQAEAKIQDITKLSVPGSRPVHVSVVLAPVTDLRFAPHPEQEDHLFDLAWTRPPGGQVVIYRTEAPPTPGIERAPLAEDALELNELKAEDRVGGPVEDLDGECSMSAILWPSGWTRAYITPVTLLDGRAFVGSTISKARNVDVRNPRILERVGNQILTFEWPEGADSVMVYLGPQGQPAENALSGQPQEVSQGSYQQYGGMHFNQVLPPTGCDVHLVPVTFEAGTRTAGSPTTVNYPGLLRLGYRVALKKNLLGKTTGAVVNVLAATPVDSVPPFVLVYNADRFPLSFRDGVALNMQLDVDGAAAAQRQFVPSGVGGPNATAWKTAPESWAADVGKGAGFLRLFAALPPEASIRVALMDPPIGTLQVGKRPGRGRGLFDAR